MGRRIGQRGWKVAAKGGAAIAATVDLRMPSVLTTPPSIMLLRLATILAAQLFDFATFTMMIARHGIAGEANPIVAQGFVAFGLPIVVIGKTALIVLCGSLQVVLLQGIGTGRTTWRLATLVALLAVAAGLAGGISNLAVT
jgi:hypothetical protein